MKFAGVLVVLMSVVGIATFENIAPPEGRAFGLRLLRFVLYLMFMGGLYLFAAGLKREIISELRPGPASPPADLPPEPVGPDDTSAPAPCPACGGTIPAGSVRCQACGWTYAAAGRNASEPGSVPDRGGGM